MGVGYPVAITSSVWDLFIVPEKSLRQYGQDEEGRTRDQLRKLNWQHWERAHVLDRGETASYILKNMDEDILEYIFGPFISGYWYGSPENTSRAMVPLLFKHIGSKEYTMKGGLGTLPADIAQGLEIRFNSPVTGISVSKNPDKMYDISYREGGRKKLISADMVVCALRAPEALEVLSSSFSEHKIFLKDINYGSSIVTAIPLTERINSNMWGMLVSRKDFKYIASSVLEHSKPNYYEQTPHGKGMLVVTTSNSGARKLADFSNNDIIRQIKTELQIIFPGIEQKFEKKISATVIKHKWAQPQFEPGHLTKIFDFKTKRLSETGLFLTGDYLCNASTEGAITDGRDVAGIIQKSKIMIA